MRLGFYKEEAYQKLKKNTDKNEALYKDGVNWVPDFLRTNDEIPYEEMSSVEVGEYDPIYVPGPKNDEQKAREDFQNAIALYEAFKNLTPMQASTFHMWTWLCHQPKYADYIRDRWMSEDRTGVAKKRFFVTNYGESLYFENALSRGWWIVHLTKDPENENPYHLTEVLFDTQNTLKDVLTTYNRMNPNRIKGVLLAIKDFKEITGKSVNEAWRECRKFLNGYGAIIVLDYLDAEEIRDLAFNCMMNAHNVFQETRK